MPFDALRKQSRELVGGTADASDDAKVVAVGLLNCYMGSDLVELNGMPLTMTLKPGENPVATPIVRALASRTAMVPNRRHEVVRLSDLDRQLVPLLDGSNDRKQLAEKLAEVTQSGLLNIQKDGAPLTDANEIREAIGSVLDQALTNIAKMGILVK